MFTKCTFYSVLYFVHNTCHILVAYQFKVEISSASVLAPQMLLLPLTHLSYKHPDFSCHSIQIFLLCFFSPPPLGASHPCSPGGGEEGSLNIFGFSSLLFDASSLGALATLLFLQGSRPLSPPPEWMHYQMHSLLECVTLSLHNLTTQ